MVLTFYLFPGSFPLRRKESGGKVGGRTNAQEKSVAADKGNRTDGGAGKATVY